MELHIDYREFLSLTVHDNGECRLSRAGCGGREYYKYQDALSRIDDFSVLKYPCNLGLLFCDGGEREDYYLPSKKISKVVVDDLKSIWSSTEELRIHIQDVPNIENPGGGWDSIPGFDHHKKSGMTRFHPVAKYQIEAVAKYEKFIGFPMLGKNILYCD